MTFSKNIHIITDNKANLIFKPETLEADVSETIWTAKYAKDKFKFDFHFRQGIFTYNDLELDWEIIKQIVNSMLQELGILDKKSTNLCKALYTEVLGSIDTDAHPFELSNVEIMGLRKMTTTSEKIYEVLFEFDYFQEEDYNVTYAIKIEFKGSHFSIGGVRRGNGYDDRF